MKPSTTSQKKPTAPSKQITTTRSSWLVAATPPRWINVTWGILFAWFVLASTLFSHRYLLWELHDQNLFIADGTYLNDCLKEVGGAIIYLSTFLNQWFYYPTLGACVYLALLLVVVLLTATTYRLKGWGFPLALIPGLLLLLALLQNGYLIYLLKLEGFAYVCILGTLVMLMAPYLGRRLQNLPGQAAFILTYLILAYPLAGAYGLAGGLLYAIPLGVDAIVRKRWNALLLVGITLVGILIIPQVYYAWVFETIIHKRLYLCTLPDYFWNGEERSMWLPYLLLFTGFLLAGLSDVVHPPYANKPRFWHLTPVMLVLLCVLLVVKRQYRDANFTTQIAMKEAAEKQDWNRVLRLFRQAGDEPTRLMVMHKNLALTKLGKRSDTQYTYVEGSKPMNSPRRIFDVQLAGPFFYLNYGRINYCYKWCMEGMVEYGMSPTYLKNFVRSCLLNGETKLAAKYNLLLARSPLYKDWAKQHQPLIEDSTLVESDPYFAAILPLTWYEDRLDGDFSLMENYLRKDYASLIGGSREMVELCILFNMELKDIDRFWPAFFYWMHRGERPGRHMQEAALLFQHLEKKFQLNTSRFDPQVLHRFQDFLAMVNQYANYPENAVVNLYRQRFGDTYWFYYFFVNDHSKNNANGEQKPYSS